VERRATGVPVFTERIELMFLGQYQHNIDDKGRLTIPARFRDLLADGAYVIRGFDRNLMVLTPAYFEALYDRVNHMNLTDPTARLLKRLIFSGADRVEVDKAGRILLPQFLRQSASLNGDVVVVGVGEFFEIWSPEHWTEQVNQLQDAEANAQRFAAFDLSANP
jgi:MraZ protein